MASVIVDTSIAAADGGPLQLNSIPIVDLRTLSQSELYSLSLCSSSPLDPLRCEDVVIPKIDRSVFNESAGSRKQTYSRLRLAPPSSSSSTTSAIPRRRTPHLRPTTLTNYYYNNSNSDPDKEENSQIISLLKQLFVTDANPDVKIDYSDSHLPKQSLSIPSSSNVAPLNLKRKRGRTCRHDLLESNTNSLQGAKADSHGGDHNKHGFPVINEIFVRENVGDRDRNVLNKDGVAVDLVALGFVEDPYGEEIRQRTEGLKGQEELLRFLEGLNGQWGSTRKKRRIVDANMFGSALPIDWKLLLAVKKKAGHVWLHCRRYISPSGQQFVSFKDISSYLLSLNCVQDTNKANCAENIESANDANNLASINIANFTSQDGSRKENLSLAATSTSGNQEMQFMLNAGDLPEDKVGQILHCDKCKMTFNEKDDFLHHQLSHHQENRYKNDLKSRDAETFNKITNDDGFKNCSPCSKFNDHVGDRMEENDNLGVAKVMNTVSMTSQSCCGNELLLSNNEDKSYHEASVNASIPDGVAEIFDDACNGRGRSSEIRSPLPYTEEAGGVNNVVESSATLEDSKQDSLSQSGLFDLTDNKETCDVVNEGLSCPAPKLDAEKFVDEDSIFGFCSSPVGEVKDSAVRVEQCSNFEDLSCENVDVSVPSFSTEIWSEQNKETKRSYSTPYGHGEVVVEDSVPISVDEYMLDGSCNFRTNENESSEADKEERHLETYSVIPSWNEQASVVQDYGNEVTCLVKELGVQNTSKGSLLALADHERNVGAPHYADKICTSDGIQNVRTGEMFFPFSTSSHNAVNSDAVTGCKDEKNLRLCSPSPFEKKKNFGMEDDVIRVISTGVEECKQEPTGGVLLTQSRAAEASEVAYTVNKISTTSLDDLKFHDIENTKNTELSLTVGHLHTEPCANPDRIEQERNLLASFSVQYGTERSYGLQTNPSNMDSGIVEDAKQGKSLGIDFLDPPLNPKACEFGNFSTTYSGGVWDGPRGNQVGHSDNFIAGFGSNNLQAGEDVMAGSLWRTGQGNVMQGCFAAATSSQVQPPSCFHASDIMPDKDDGMLEVNENYNINSTGTARTEPVEYSFLGSHTNSLPAEPNVFSYDAHMNEGLDPAFWLKRNDAMPNITDLNKSSSICVWCRTVFFHEPIQTDMEAGAIGLMCPACGPGQFIVP